MIIVHVVEPFAAGIAVFVKYLTETMPGDLHIIVHGERKQVMCAVDVKKTFSSPNVRFVKWRSAQRSINPFKDFLALAELYKILKRLKNKDLVDSIHLHSSKSGLLGRIACKMLGLKNVFYTPNGAPFLSGKTVLSKYLYRQIERFGNNLGGKVVCCSPSELNAYLRLGIEATYISNGIAVEDKTQTAIETKKEKFRIITSGRIIDQKNPTLFNSIANYFNELDQFEFIWAGDGNDRHLLTAKNIIVTGWVNQKEIKKLLSEADMYLSTALYEGLSFGVLEALTLHKPVLLSHCVGNTDVVKNGINGDLFKTQTEAIVKILQYYNNRDMLKVMGSFSKSICEAEFNVKNNFSSYRELYTNTINLTPGKKWAFA
ncbi:MAG TPA: glycosyltransferase [Chitinophagaceae bacterium]|nr:glycosyltransferase [Chitinophagaceae bacterium]